MLEFTEKAIHALELAETVSRELRHRYVGSEHLLCGLMREGTGVAAKDAHLEEHEVISLIDQYVSSAGGVAVRDHQGYTPSAKRILEQAKAEAEHMQSDRVGTEHLLIAILKNTDCIATRILNTLGASPQRLYNDIQNIIGDDLPEMRANAAGRSAGADGQRVMRQASDTPTLDQYPGTLLSLR